MTTLIEKQQTEIQADLGLPLVDSWVEALSYPLSTRDRIRFLLDNSQFGELEEMGFPGDLLEVMTLWREKGPDIVTSFSHPEKPDLYKIVGVLNLRLFLEQFSSIGRDFGKVVVNYYDTVSIKPSAKRPMALGELGSSVNFFGIDEFGFGGLNISAEHLIKNNTRLIQPTVEELVNQFEQSVIEPYVKTRTDSPQRAVRKEAREKLSAILESRLQDLISCFPSEDLPQKKMLMEFERNFTALIFDLGTPLEDSLGAHSALFSENEEYLSLVRKSLEMVMEKRGIDFFKKILNPGEGLAMVGRHGEMLTMSEDGVFEMDGMRISDKTAREIILKTGLPLGKLETVAIIAGGYALHMGSEYGIRDRVLDALDIPNSQARRYLNSLRIGQDKEAGNFCVGNENENPIPIVMAYVLLGKEGVRELVENVAGKTKDKRVLNRRDLKRFFVDALRKSLEEEL